MSAPLRNASSTAAWRARALRVGGARDGASTEERRAGGQHLTAEPKHARLRRGPGRHFVVSGNANGAPVRFLFDFIIPFGRAPVAPAQRIAIRMPHTLGEAP